VADSLANTGNVSDVEYPEGLRFDLAAGVVFGPYEDEVCFHVVASID